MPPGKKTLVTVSVVVCVISFFIFARSFANLKSKEIEIDRYKTSLIKDNLALKDQLDAIQDAFNRRSQAITLLEEETKEFADKIESLRKENDSILVSFRGQLDTLKKKNAILRRKVDDLENSPILKRIRDAARFEEDAEIKKALDDAASKIEAIQSGAVPAPVTSEPAAEGIEKQEPSVQKSAPIPAVNKEETLLNGTVLSVNKENNLLVISLGTKDGVSEGDHLKVLKKGREIASAEVIGIRYRISAAIVDDIDSKYKITDIKKGDPIVLSGQ